MAIPSFIFGGDTGETPDSIKRKREMVQALMSAQRAPRNVGEGLNALGDGIVSAVLGSRADAGEKAGRESANSAFNSIAGALAGPSAFPSAPGASSADGDSVSASPMVRPDDPNLPSRLDFARADARAGASGSLPSSFLAAVDSAEGGGDYDTLYGFAQRDGGKFAGTRISEMPIKDAIAFSDPNGPYAQTVKGQIGHVATPMGRHQIVGTTLRNAVSEMGLDPNTPFNRQTQDAIAGHLARKRIAGETTMDGKVAALRSEWHGFKNVPTAQMRQIVADLEAGGVPSAAPVQVASLDPSAGMAEALRPMPEEYSKNGMTQATWERMNAPNGAVPPPSPRQNVVNAVQQAAPQQPQANPQIAQALVGGGKLPVTAGGTGGAIEYGPQGGPSIQMLMQIANEPFLNDNQRSIVNALIGQQVKASDPMRQLQMRKLQQDLNATPERKTVTINGRLVDAQTGQEIANFEDPNAKAPTVQKLKLDDGSEMAVQWNPKTGKWDPIDAPQGGGGIAPKTKLTENQSKLTLFQSLQTESQPVLIDLEKQFNPANIPDAAARSAPIAGNFFQSEQGQIYEAASTAWAEGALRIATGAAATPEEMERTKKAYFAQPGDTPITIAFKAQMRDMYNRSIERALGKQSEGSLPKPSDFVKQFQKGGASTSGGGSNPPTVIDGYTIEEVE